MWDMEGGRALVLSAGRGATKHRDGGPSLLGSRTVLKQRSGVGNRAPGTGSGGAEDLGCGGWGGGYSPPHRASSHDKSLRPRHLRSQHLVTASQRDLKVKRTVPGLGICVRPSAHPIPSLLLKPSTRPQVHRCVHAWHVGTSVWRDPGRR